MEFTLQENEPVKLDSGSLGVTVNCSKGKIWLTDGSSRDRVLQGGGSCFVEKNSSVVIESLSASAVSLQYPSLIQKPSIIRRPVTISTRAAAMHA